MEIKSFKINKLHETLNFELKFENNTLILLGENGSCKTTIIKMLYYTLSLQWEKLCLYDFESIEINIDNAPLVIDYKKILSLLEPIDGGILRDLPSHISNAILSSINGREIDFQRIREVCNQYDYPIDRIIQGIIIEKNTTLPIYPILSSRINTQKQSVNKYMQNLREKVKHIHVLYLPTYRRIEQDLKVVLEGKIKGSDFTNRKISQKNDNYTELVEFGMQDVDDAIKRALTNLKESSRANLNDLTLGYLGDIVDKTYESINVEEIKDIDDDTTHQIMNRVDKSILSDKSKQKLFDTLKQIKERGIKSDHDKVVCHYFLKLYESHKELNQKETSIRDFVRICNRYLENKTMYYDSPSFSFGITSNHDHHNIKLFQLSSGEKQIVSLFSHLYLSNKSNYLVLIDEPELSLSVKWQKTFLEDVRNGAFCNGLVAVTHSPFIFENNLDEYAHGIEEFRK